MFVNVSCVKRRPKEETESKENSGLNIQKIKSIRRKLFKGYSNKEGISKKISALKKSLSIKKISYSPKKSWEKPQYCNNWGDTRDFETKKSKLDNTFINEFGNDYAQGSFQGHTGSSFGHKKWKQFDTYKSEGKHSNKRSIIVKKMKDDTVSQKLTNSNSYTFSKI